MESGRHAALNASDHHHGRIKPLGYSTGNQTAARLAIDVADASAKGARTFTLQPYRASRRSTTLAASHRSFPRRH